MDLLLVHAQVLQPQTTDTARGQILKAESPIMVHITPHMKTVPQVTDTRWATVQIGSTNMLNVVGSKESLCAQYTARQIRVKQVWMSKQIT